MLSPDKMGQEINVQISNVRIDPQSIYAYTKMLDSLNKLINTENKMEEEEIKTVEAEAKSLKLKQQQEEMKNAEISEEDQTILDMYYESLHRPQILEIKSKAENDNTSNDNASSDDNSLNEDESLNEDI